MELGDLFNTGKRKNKSAKKRRISSFIYSIFFLIGLVYCTFNGKWDIALVLLLFTVYFVSDFIVQVLKRRKALREQIPREEEFWEYDEDSCEEDEEGI